jgi:hypothetical protein
MRINAHTVSPSAQDPAIGEIGSPHEEMPLLQELACLVDVRAEAKPTAIDMIGGSSRLRRFFVAENPEA